MAENTPAPTEGAIPAAAPAAPEAKAQTARSDAKGRAVVPAGEHGGFMTLNNFLQSTGQEVPNDWAADDFEPEPSQAELDRRAEGDVAPEITEKDDDEEAEEEAEQEASADEDDEEESDQEEKPKVGKGKSFKAKRPDGSEIEVPDDIVILHTVDGEVQEIPLKEHMNIVAGELTVNQRLGKIASFKEEVQKRLDVGLEREKRFEEKLTNLTNLALSDKPEQAFVYLAELSGKSPVQMYQQMLKEAVKAAQAFDGKTPAEIENHFLKLDADWQRSKKQKEQAEAKQKGEVDVFLRNLDSELKSENLSHEEFTVAVEKLALTPDWQNLSSQERKDKAIQTALGEKHVGLVTEAVRKVDAKLGQNEKFLQLVLKQTDNSWSVDEIVALIKEVYGDERKRIASNLSKRAGNKPQSSQKKNDARPEKRKFRTMSEVKSYFGL